MQNITKRAGRFTWHQTKLRVKDYKKTIKFYEDHFQMSLINKYDFPDDRMSLFYMASILPEQKKNLPEPGSKEASDFLWNYKGTLLNFTYNYGTDKDPDFSYHTGNSQINDKTKDGFGHIAFHVDDVYKFCENLQKAGVEFQKTPDGGKMKGIAFAKDPDGYWIEIIKRPENTNLQGQITLGQTMLRIKDPKKSLKFYEDYMQMTPICIKHHDDFSLYFLATLPEDGSIKPPQDLTSKEASDLSKSMEIPVLELTHNHGTEKMEDFKYLNGNTNERIGFGHIGFLVDDVNKACDLLEKEGIEFYKKPNEGKIKGLGFAKDPDGYYIEIVTRGQSI